MNVTAAKITMEPPVRRDTFDSEYLSESDTYLHNIIIFRLYGSLSEFTISKVIIMKGYMDLFYILDWYIQHIWTLDSYRRCYICNEDTWTDINSVLYFVQQLHWTIIAWYSYFCQNLIWKSDLTWNDGTVNLHRTVNLAYVELWTSYIFVAQ